MDDSLDMEQEFVYVKNENCKFPKEAEIIARMMEDFDPNNDVNWIEEDEQ